MVRVDNGPFLFRKLSVDSNVSGLSFFAIKHIRKHGKFLRGMNCSDLEYFSKHSKQNSQGIAQNYQCKPSNEA